VVCDPRVRQTWWGGGGRIRVYGGSAVTGGGSVGALGRKRGQRGKGKGKRGRRGKREKEGNVLVKHNSPWCVIVYRRGVGEKESWVGGNAEKVLGTR
jgi:hypothetical protein